MSDHPYLRPDGQLYRRHEVEALARTFQEAYPGFKPSIGLYTGTGFASFKDEFEDAVVIPYSDLPYFPKTLQTPMHVSEFVLGRVAGKQVICACGKMFLLDGVPAQLIALPVRLFYSLGCRTLVYTNTTGAINPAYKPGDFVLVHNHINLMARNPLVGEPNGEWGSLFFDMTHPYDAGLRQLAKRVGSNQGLDLQEGVYTGVLGPSFETAAEIQMMTRIGGDVVGMSTVMEVVAARQLGMRVLAISFVSNMAAGVSDALVNNEDVQVTAAGRQAAFARLLSGVIAEIEL